MFQTDAERVLRSLWDLPCRIDCEGVDPAEGCGIALVVGGVDHRDDVTEYSMDVGECLPLQGCKDCDMGMVWEHIEDDPRSYRTALRFAVIGKGGYSGSRCA